MVHAYLMYGFPTQTEQETIDALEIVRQFFKEGLIQSAFWHLFTATAHSDVGKNPEKYHCTILDQPVGRLPEMISCMKIIVAACIMFCAGAEQSCVHFMHGIGTDLAIKDWFDFPVPAISVKRNYVKQAINVHRITSSH